VLLVDGYNVIRQTAPYCDLAAKDELELARDALIADVAAFASTEWDATVVFDGGANPQSVGETADRLGVTVVFSAYGTEADHVIESLAHEARTRGDEVEVVSSDAQTQWAVMGRNVTRRSAAEFALQMRDEGVERLSDHGGTGFASRIEDRVGPSVRARLERMARGEDGTK
jgi:predicted RNA-binding protein with PIN domain